LGHIQVEEISYSLNIFVLYYSCAVVYPRILDFFGSITIPPYVLQKHHQGCGDFGGPDGLGCGALPL